RILVNMGDKETTNDDIREFIRLDTPESEKQFILLVNKGREGWNCRSLFGVAMYRAPKSKVFVLQATMRCLRSIGETQQTGQVYLSDQNLKILNDELQQNFRITAEELQNTAKDKETVKIRVKKQPKLTLRRVRRSYKVHEKELTTGFELIPERKDKEKWFDLTKKYHVTETVQHGMAEGGISSQIRTQTNDLTHIREKLEYSEIMLVAEISRYLNKSPLLIESILEKTDEQMTGLLEMINEYNELLYDQIIPRLFNQMYEVETEEATEEHEVELIKIPPQGYYEMRADPKLTMRDSDKAVEPLKDKSFHLDTYCFDSQPEQQLFWDLLNEGKVKEIYFTGMLTHGQSDFFIQYIDPDSRAVRSYYPDFIFKKEDDSYVIVEVKGDNKWEDPIVNAKKEFAEQMAVASGMEYKMIKGSDASAREFRRLLQ
ncbi:MAG: TnsA endonuclease N-terminal domain-containing protein, partial [Pseudomonadota bacterium]|nr:TnsA endonuclease N-terminal domain-containing protein [Pseudomonadota bacterium]